MGLKDDLIKREKELIQDLKDVRTAIGALTGMIINQPDTPVIESDSTDLKSIKDLPWLDQIIHVIKNKNRFLHNVEIATILQSLYQQKTIHEIKRRISSVVSQAVSKNKVEGLTSYKFSNSKKDTVWGKKDWIDNNGDIKPEYQYKEISKGKAKRKIEL